MARLVTQAISNKPPQKSGAAAAADSVSAISDKTEQDAALKRSGYVRLCQRISAFSRSLRRVCPYPHLLLLSQKLGSVCILAKPYRSYSNTEPPLSSFWKEGFGIQRVRDVAPSRRPGGTWQRRCRLGWRI